MKHTYEDVEAAWNGGYEEGHAEGLRTAIWNLQQLIDAWTPTPAPAGDDAAKGISLEDAGIRDACWWMIDAVQSLLHDTPDLNYRHKNNLETSVFNMRRRLNVADGLADPPGARRVTDAMVEAFYDAYLKKAGVPLYRAYLKQALEAALAAHDAPRVPENDHA